MNKIYSHIICLFLILSGISLLGQESEKIQYVCPPCGHNCLETIYEAPGYCGQCGMQYVDLKTIDQNQPAAGQQQQQEALRVAVLVFEGVQIIDYTGPWEVFGGAHFEVFSVAKNTDQLRTVYGMQVVPQFTLENHPPADILLIPGGNVLATQEDPAVQRWLQEKSESARIVLSVCNGAYILAKAGLLNGLRATTTRHLVNGLANAAPNITIVRDVRYVDNGKIITSGGLSAGMDAALHVVERMTSRERAAHLARGLEYDWLEIRVPNNQE